MTSDILEWAPAFALALARIGAAMAFMPGLGEASAPAIVRIGVALAMTGLLLPDVRSMMPAVPDAGMTLALMLAAEVFTGLWFGWLARMIVVALPVCAQIASTAVGLSSVLQPDPELGAQASVPGKAFEMAVPPLILASGLYRLPLLSLHGLFVLIPPGQMLPADDSAGVAVRAVTSGFALAVQLAAPFIALTVVWHVAIGLAARLVARMQIYFVSLPGQIIVGLLVMATVSGTIMLSWRGRAETLLLALPGGP